MNRLAIVFALVVLGFIGTSDVARANAIDALSLTPSGTDTIFAITGTYPPDTPTTPFSSPNAAYSLTFDLPTAPSSLAFVDMADGIFGIDTTVTLNGVTFLDSQIAFFVAALGGGLDVCLSEDCSPNPPATFDRWVILGDQLFSGSVSDPVFSAGAANVDPSQSFIEAPVPEPSTLSSAAVGFGVALLVLYRRRKCDA